MQKDPALPVNLSDPPRSPVTGNKSRHVADLSNLPVLGRTALLSRVQQVATEVAPVAKYPALLAFFQFWKWLLPYLRDCLHSNAPYRVYSGGKTGIFGIAAPGEVKIAVAADWGTGTLEAETVAENMHASSPEYTVHLGDVYYMGEACEIAENCLGRPTPRFTGVSWPRGSLGSFALMGNHEMYSGGYGYFHHLLPKMGLCHHGGAVRDPQSASYFCLETDDWLIFGLDTGYHSGGIPLLTAVPVVNDLPFLNVDARFHPNMMEWLNRTITRLSKQAGGSKSVLLLTHHQPVSSFEHAFHKPAEQLAEIDFLKGRDLVWLYGHEHRLTIYGQQTIANELRVHPRCIGHGGMPVEVTRVPQPDPRILFYDPRQHPIDQKDPDKKVGYNGHAVLLFHGSRLTIEYHDILNNAVLLSETFAPAGEGRLEHTFSLPSGSPLVSGK
jgi:hypothetical protein